MTLELDLEAPTTPRKRRARAAAPVVGPASSAKPRRARRSRAANPSELERDIKARIMIALGREPDVLVMDNPSGVARYGRAAVPYGVGLAHRGGADLICVGPGGVFMALEVKSLDGEQREAQIAFEAAVRARGGEYRLIRSPEEALAWLADLRRRHG